MNQPFNDTGDAFGATSRALADQAEHVAFTLLGDASQKTRRELRWGSKGSFSLALSGHRRGRWCDWETDERGDMLDLVARVRGVRPKEALSIGREILGAPVSPIATKPRAVPKDDEELAKRVERARRMWRETVPLKDTLGANYLFTQRRIDVDTLDVEHAVRWHEPTKAIVALMRSPFTGEPSGIHRTFVNPDTTKRWRGMLAPKGVICLTPSTEVTMGLGITEGLEDGLSILAAGWLPVWVACDAGAIKTFPVLSGVEFLTIFADADATGIKAACACAQRWKSNDRQVRIVAPRGLQ